MLTRLQILNFTAFAKADFEFGPGINVIVGTNGTGKSHVLKLGYAVQLAYAAAPREIPGVYLPDFSSTSSIVIATLLTRLQEAFLTNGLHKLVRRAVANNRRVSNQSSIRATLGEEPAGKIEFTIDDIVAGSHGYLMSPQVARITAPAEKPVFIPAKELLSLMPDIIGLSDRYADLLDGTYTGLAKALVIPLLKNPPVFAQQAIATVGTLLQGRVESENGRFYLAPQQGGERFDIHLVAEGYRKLGTLAYLLANGSLDQGNTLYWDEPEANLNPNMLRELAGLLWRLAEHGIQIMLATHSLFLLKELHILSRQQPNPIRYFSLSAQDGGPTQVTMRDNLELLPDIVTLDAELDQTDRFQAVLDQEDAH